MTGMRGVVDGGVLVGRDPELSLIATTLADRERGAAIVIRGPAGIGKTALVEEAVRRASPGRRILRTFGSAPETGLPMAGLYQLLQPLLPLGPPDPRA